MSKRAYDWADARLGGVLKRIDRYEANTEDYPLEQHLLKRLATEHQDGQRLWCEVAGLPYRTRKVLQAWIAATPIPRDEVDGVIFKWEGLLDYPPEWEGGDVISNLLRLEERGLLRLDFRTLQSAPILVVDDPHRIGCPILTQIVPVEFPFEAS